jgi:hypothetical protein
MRKNFFKKLSFVLALAMIISVIAPAAGAFAASAPKLNSTKKYLHLDKDGANDFDFNITNKQKGWKYNWSSANEAVATVKKNGVVTATGVGTTKVSVVISEDGEEVDELSATVTVRDNIAELTSLYIQGASPAAVDKLAVGTVYDFGRKFKTVSGSTTKTGSVTRWSVDKTTATIGDSGKFTATVAGKYVITARSFQSASKYASWKGDNTKYASYVLAIKTVDVTVLASIVSVKQVNLSKFNVEFDSDMSASDIATKAVVSQVINGKDVVTGAEKIKKVTFDTTGKIATVELFTNLTSKAVYNFVYGELKGTFTAADTNISNVVAIGFDDFTTNVTTGAGQEMKDKVNGLNKDGVAIVPGTLLANLSFKYGGDLTKGYVTGSMAYIYTEGYSATITAEFTNFVYNEATKTYDTLKSTDTATATGVKPNTALNTTTMQYAIGASVPAGDSSTWSASSVSIAAKESTLIFTRFKNNDASTASGLTAYVAGASRFTYTSSNTDLLLIAPNTNSMYAIAPGSVTVIVKDTTNNNAVVGTFEVVILAARTFASVAIDTTSVSVGNNATVGETANFKITSKDSMNTTFVATATPSFVNYPTNADLSKVIFTAPTTNTSDNTVTIGVSARGAVAGAYNVKLVVSGTVAGTTSTKDLYLTVIVIEANTAATTGVAMWKVDLGKTSVDLKNVDAAITSSIDVYGYNSANVRVAKLAAADYAVTVKKGDTTVSTVNTTFDIATVSGGVVTPIAVDTYVVTATVIGNAIAGRVAGSHIGTSSITVLDTTTKAVTVDTLVVSGAAVTAAALEAFTFSYNGTSVETMNAAGSDTMALNKVIYSKGATQLTDTLANPTVTISSGESVFVSEVWFTKTDADAAHNTIVYKFAVNTTIIGK